MTRVLLATAHKFWLADRADRERIGSMCRAIRGWGIPLEFFIACEVDRADREVLRQNWAGVPCHLADDLAPFARLRRMAARAIGRAARTGGTPAAPAVGELRGLDTYYSKATLDAFRRVCGRVQPDVVVVELLRLAYLLDGLVEGAAGKPLAVIDTMDVMHIKSRSFRDAGERLWVDITREEETAVLSRFDVIMAIQPNEAKVFREMLPGKDVIVVGHAAECIPCGKPAGVPVVLGFIGSSADTNRRAADWFLVNVWPELRRRYGDGVRLQVAGAVCNSLGRKGVPEGVVLRGFVDSLPAFYSAVDIVVNPIFFGAGLKLKNTQALCFGKPLVTTSLGAEGFEEGRGTAFCVADSIADMTRVLCELTDSPDLRARFAQAALAYARIHFTEEAAYGPLREILCRAGSLRGGAGVRTAPEQEHAGRGAERP